MIGFGTAIGIRRIACRRFWSLRFLLTSEWGPGGFFSPGGPPFHPAPNECSLKAIRGSAMCRVPVFFSRGGQC